MFSPKTTSQVTTNKYELEFDKLLAKKSPEYYDVLINILSQFQESLISSNIIENNNYQSYIGLLNRISEDDKLEFDITYDLKGSLEGHVDGLNKAFSTESTLIAQNYLNIHNSKNFLFSQKVSEMKLLFEYIKYYKNELLTEKEKFNLSRMTEKIKKTPYNTT